MLEGGSWTDMRMTAEEVGQVWSVTDIREPGSSEEHIAYEEVRPYVNGGGRQLSWSWRCKTSYVLS